MAKVRIWLAPELFLRWPNNAIVSLVLNFLCYKGTEIIEVLTTRNSRPRNKAFSSAERLLGTAIKTKKCSTQKHGLQVGVLQLESGWILLTDMNVDISWVKNILKSPLTDSCVRKCALLRLWNFTSVSYVSLSTENKNNSQQ